MKTKSTTPTSELTTDEAGQRPRVIVITGLSGAGLSTAINTLQDNGFYCVDNLPIELLWDTVHLVHSGKIQARGFAFGMDIRDQRFATDFPKVKKALNDSVQLEVLFIEASAEVLEKRYSSTRRRHPLLAVSEHLSEAIQKEQMLLQPVRNAADNVIDTTHLTPAALRRVIELRCAENGHALRTLFVTISSFGFKYGQLAPAESIHDIRFLPNPFFDPALKHKTGLDQDVQNFVMKDPLSQEAFARLEDLYRFLLPQYLKEGKHFFRLGIGCTGGQHRSVTFAVRLATAFAANPLPNIKVSVVHRDIEQ